jgi:hypothetical protein
MYVARASPVLSIFYYKNSLRRILALETSQYEPIFMLGVRQQYPNLFRDGAGNNFTLATAYQCGCLIIPSQ